MVTKAMDPGEGSIREQVFEAVGQEFLQRLLLPLRAGRVTPRPMNDETCRNQVAMLGLGLSVIANLSANPHVAQQLVQAVPLCLTVLRNNGIQVSMSKYSKKEDVRVDGEVESQTRTDALEFLMHVIMSGDEEGSKVAMESGILQVVSPVIENAFNSYLIQKKDYTKEELFASMRFVQHVLTHYVKRGSPDEVNILSETTSSLIPALSKIFGHPYGMRRKGEEEQGGHDVDPVLIDCHLSALHCLSSMGSLPHWSTGDTNLPSWKSNIISGIAFVLRERGLLREKHLALHVLCSLCQHCGLECLYPQDWNEGGLQFYEMVVQTNRVEIGVLMLDASSPESIVEIPRNVGLFSQHTGEESTACSNDIRPGKETESVGERVLRNLPHCLALFESTIEILCLQGSADGFPAFPSPVEERIYKSILETAEVLLQFIEQAIARLKSKEGGIAQMYDQMILSGCIRAFGRFSAEAPDQFSQRLLSIFPDLVRYCEDQKYFIVFLMPTIIQLLKSNVVADLDRLRNPMKESWVATISSEHVLDLLSEMILEDIKIILDRRTINEPESVVQLRRIDMSAHLLLESLHCGNNRELVQGIVASENTYKALDKLLKSIEDDQTESHDPSRHLIEDLCARLCTLVCNLVLRADCREIPSHFALKFSSILHDLLRTTILQGRFEDDDTNMMCWVDLCRSAKRALKSSDAPFFDPVPPVERESLEGMLQLFL